MQTFIGADGDICAYIRFIYADMGQNKAKKKPRGAATYRADTSQGILFVDSNI